MFRLSIVCLLIATCNLAQGRDLAAASHTEAQTTFAFTSDVSLHLRASPFDSTKHQVSRCKILDWEGVCLIDGKPVLGTDWDIPRSVLESLELEIGSTRVSLEVSSLYNPWFGSPSKEFFSVSQVEGGWVVRGCFSDGDGSYVAEWLVINGGSLRTLVSRDESVMDQFPCNLPAGKAHPNPLYMDSPPKHKKLIDRNGTR